MVDHAWRMDVRYFDTAPLYGYGNAERRVGYGLAERPRQEFALSTKVGRLVVPANEVLPGTDVDCKALHGQEDSFYRGTPPGVLAKPGRPACPTRRPATTRSGPTRPWAI